MKSLRPLSVLCLVLASPAFGCPDTPRLFCDDFDGTQLNTQNWQLGTWKLGRTQLGNSPVFTSEVSNASTIAFARLRFDTYKFKGTEIWSAPLFSLANNPNGYSFKARVREGQLPSGLVTSFFTYNYDSVKKAADEIDIEVLTKKISNLTDTNLAQFTTWNDWTATSSYSDNTRYNSTTVTTPLKVGIWHTYEMQWHPKEVDWYIDGALVAKSTNAIPDMSTYIRLNFWAPDSSWTAAYDSSLKPTNILSQNKTYYYDVDWVQVTALP